ncbi:MAG: hypothetical protein K6G75_08690 [Lachnospiraceae bacterium]|nr:hypothetical protein [Lachnospiraceae bacterium]
MEDKKTKKISFKKILRFLLFVLAGFSAAALIFFLVTHKIIFDGIDLISKTSRNDVYNDEYDYGEVHLTKEQMLTDFEYFYDHLYTDSLVREQAEKYLDIDYSALHDSYRERIEDCKDEFEFFSIMTSLNAKLPGAHDYVSAPGRDMSDTTGFPLSYELVTDEVVNTNFAYYSQFEDRMFSYYEKYIYMVYLNGDYVAIYEGFNEEELIPGIENAKLVSLNGKEVKDVLPELDTIHKFSYDAMNDSMYVHELIFNDGVGNKYDAVLQLADGTLVNKELYCSCEFTTALYFRDRRYPDHYAADSETETSETETTETASEEETDSEVSVSRCYSIQKDPERNLVIVSIAYCDSFDSEYAFNDITEALDEVDAKSVIIDNRSNKGGNCNFVIKGICPALFNYDYKLISYARSPINDMTDLLYGNSFYKTFFEHGLKKHIDCYEYYEDFSFKGKAKKKYDIYVLNGNSTFSSGDILAGIMSEQPDVILIGNNTGGEGFSGHPLNYYLPESKIPYTMAFSVSEKFPDDNYLGIVPDVYAANGWENWLVRNELKKSLGSDGNILSYEARMIWDDVMIEAVNMIDSKNQ